MDFLGQCLVLFVGDVIPDDIGLETTVAVCDAAGGISARRLRGAARALFVRGLCRALAIKEFPQGADRQTHVSLRLQFELVESEAGGADKLFGGHQSNRFEILGPQTRDNVVVFFLVGGSVGRTGLVRGHAPERLQKKGEVFVREPLMEAQLTDPVRVHFKRKAISGGVPLRFVDHFVLKQELIALDQQGEASVLRQMIGQLIIKLLKESLGDRVLRAIRTRRFGRLVEQLQQLLDGSDLRIGAGFHEGRKRKALSNWGCRFHMCQSYREGHDSSRK